ncbi:hypothetical protein N9887_00800 [Flavobacteriaceae bacterium]|nr:hypothetical protein [Flavobacteriaceae bacterium]
MLEKRITNLKTDGIMKSMYLILTLFFLITGCNEEDTKQQENSIYGTWQLTQLFVVDGVDGSWQDIENGFIFTLNKDNSFSSNKYQECSVGNYFIDMNNNKITFEYNCSDFTPCESNSSKCVETFVFENQLLKFTPEYSSCIEGCGQRFKKIISE